MSDTVGPGGAQEFASLTSSHVLLLDGGPHKILEGASLTKRVKKVDLLCLDKRRESPDLIRTLTNREAAWVPERYWVFLLQWTGQECRG